MRVRSDEKPLWTDMLHEATSNTPPQNRPIDHFMNSCHRVAVPQENPDSSTADSTKVPSDRCVLGRSQWLLSLELQLVTDTRDEARKHMIELFSKHDPKGHPTPRR